MVDVVMDTKNISDCGLKFGPYTLKTLQQRFKEFKSKCCVPPDILVITRGRVLIAN